MSIVRILVQPVVNAVSLVHTAASSFFGAIGVEAAHLFSERAPIYTDERRESCQRSQDEVLNSLFRC
ncbi:MAG TPA: hypothetical protein VF597_00440 [Candidatus Saccharimonadales bacterium]|jgi:hypothetical protein